MTAKQKANALRFKKAIAEAKKLRAKNPKLSQAQAVKQAWAILYKGGNVGDYKLNNTEFVENRIPISPRKKTLKKKKEFAVLREYDGTFKKIKRISGVKTATKKTAKKKATAKSYHKDTKSHNVNIRVMSGTMGEISDSVIHTIKEYDKKRNEHEKKYKFWKENSKMYGRGKSNSSLKYAREHKNMANYYTKQIQKLRLKIK
jgi:hypothetical protein